MLVFMFSPGPFRIAPYIRVAFLIMTIRYALYLLKLLLLLATIMNITVGFPIKAGHTV